MTCIALGRAGCCATLAFAVGVAAAASAPDLDPSQPLTEDRLVAWVLERNPGVAALGAAAEAVGHRSAPAGALDDPLLSYQTAPRTLDSGGLDQRIEVRQRFPWPGTLAARAAVARHEAAAAQADLEELRLEVAAQARSALAQWRFVHEALAIHQATRALLEELIATATTLYAAGQSRRQDVLQAEVERTDLDAEALRLRRRQTVVQARINALLNRRPDALLPPAAPLGTLPDPPSLEILERLALARHPELARLDARLAAGGSRITLAEKAFYPDFEVGVGYDGLWEESAKRPMLGISLSLPLDRGKRRAARDGARAEARAAEWTLAERRAGLRAELAQTRAAVIEQQRSVQLHDQELIPLADEYLDAAIADYRSGTGAFVDVLAAERRKLAAELALARARADYAASRAALDRAAGVIPGQPGAAGAGGPP